MDNDTNGTDRESKGDAFFNAIYLLLYRDTDIQQFTLNIMNTRQNLSLAGVVLQCPI